MEDMVTEGLTRKVSNIGARKLQTIGEGLESPWIGEYGLFLSNSYPHLASTSGVLGGAASDMRHPPRTATPLQTFDPVSDMRPRHGHTTASRPYAPVSD